MKSQESNDKNTQRHIKDSSSKTARGSKDVHSKKDNSTSKGFVKNKKEEE